MYHIHKSSTAPDSKQFRQSSSCLSKNTLAPTHPRTHRHTYMYSHFKTKAFPYILYVTYVDTIQDTPTQKIHQTPTSLLNLLVTQWMQSNLFTNCHRFLRLHGLVNFFALQVIFFFFFFSSVFIKNNLLYCFV